MPNALYPHKAGPNDWIIYIQSIFHKSRGVSGRERTISNLPGLDDLTPGQSVGLAVTPKGQLHIFFSGIHLGQIATDVPVDTPIWGMADIFGQCTKIKSETLRGESCGVI